MSDLSNDFVITDENFAETALIRDVDGERVHYGLVPRNYRLYPLGYRASQGIVKFNIPLIPRVEWPSRIRDLEQSKSRLSDLRNIGDNGRMIQSLDQNGQGYCWAYSTTSGAMLCRARDGQPYVRLSGHSMACKIKNFRDQGGWNAQSVEFIIKNGCASTLFWPEKSMNRTYDNPATWENAKNYQLTEGFMDIVPAQWDRNLSFDQWFTCLLLRIPCPSDYNWWRHSVCAMDPVEVDDSLPLSDIRRWGGRIWNSWRDSYGLNGTAVLVGNRAVPNGSTAMKSLELAA